MELAWLRKCFREEIYIYIYSFIFTRIGTSDFYFFIGRCLLKKKKLLGHITISFFFYVCGTPNLKHETSHCKKRGNLRSHVAYKGCPGCKKVETFAFYLANKEQNSRVGRNFGDLMFFQSFFKK